MSGNAANTTIAPPPNWQMLWGNGAGFYNFQLDIVGFLAVLGESSVVANAQALLPPNRPTDLPSRKAWVTSVHTGNAKEHVHHVANILLGEELSLFEVRCVEVTKKQEPKPADRLDTIFRGIQTSARESANYDPPPVKAKATGPLTWVTLTGFFLSVSLFITSFVLGDGYSMLATLLLSFLSTLIGIANKWTLRLAKRPTGNAPDDAGDLVIRYPNGSFLVVKCDDEVARELYFAPEEIKYTIKSPAVYRIISLLATLILMLGIIFLANAKLQLQFAWAASYGIINAAHWAAAALPARSHWDLSCYVIREQSVVGGPENKTFTEALWKAIVLAKGTTWVRNGSSPAAPQTKTWDKWLDDASDLLVTRDELKNPGIGRLVNPVIEWAGDTPEKGTVWNMPKDWDPKAAWDKIYQDKKEEEKAGKIHV
ncbi:uncharacterized protein LTR77_005025 [Saxophila tyrrhenica]|uniref:Uncharacterized protein n=1 Tax=Saxophila tyrrhenica TaxID=1690608 RepID=A0AAV9PE74_9PEZI|nr:hypothetical protein LTR77_005025 [Saxophila tyrrhenica]